MKKSSIIRTVIGIKDSYRGEQLPNELRITESHRPRRDLNPRLRSKYFKMCQHEIMPDADVFIWADGTFEIRAGIAEWMIHELGDADVLFIRHPRNNSVKEEVGFVEDGMRAGDAYLQARYAGEPMREQCDYYLSQGFPDTQLLCGGLFIRKNTPQVNRAFDEWFMENVKWTIQDQISLPYILWKHGLTVKVLDSKYLYGGPYHTFAGH